MERTDQTHNKTNKDFAMTELNTTLACAKTQQVSHPTNPVKTRASAAHKAPCVAPVRFTLIENATGPCAKKFGFDAQGKFGVKASANVYEGRAREIVTNDLRGFLNMIAKLQTNQALCYGVPSIPDAVLATQAQLKNGASPNTIARDREHFSFADGAPGMLFLDHDPRKGHPPKNWKDLDAILCEVAPGWRETERAWKPSSSAFIYSADGKELIGAGGWRCYVRVDDASAIPTIGAAIYQALWKAGHGYITVSKAGQALDRSLIDPAVWQPERLDFAAAPILHKGLVRRAPAPVILPGAPLLVSARYHGAATLREWRSTSPDLAKARKAATAEIETARKTYIETRVKTALRDASAPGLSKVKVLPASVRAMYRRAVTERALSGAFVLHRADGNTTTVAALLNAPDTWHGERFADPLEPDYRRDKRIAVACLKPDHGDPYLYSHAHGGMRFALVRESAEIRLVTGEQPRVVDEALALLRDRGEVYERGGEMVRLTRDGLAPVADEWLLDYYGRHVIFKTVKVTQDGATETRKDAPTWLARRVSAKSGERGLKEVKAVITAPTLREDGSILATPGYDAASGLLLRGNGKWPRVPETPSRAELETAASALWHPFQQFPFVDEISRGVMLAALLTAVVRQTLPTAPGFMFDAPSASSGKTLLAKCAMMIGGAVPAAIAECSDDDEIRKRTFSALREGATGLLFDNLRGDFTSSTLEAYLTSQEIRERVLGVSQTVIVPNTALFLFSGNNLRLKGDLWRRILITRIDAKTDAPERRSFDFDPLALCRERRQELVAAALTLLRGFIAAGSPRATPDKVGSFEVWDDRVRQAVVWIGREGQLSRVGNFGDPGLAIERAKAAEPERVKLAAFLSAVHALKGDGRWRVAELIEAARGMEHRTTDDGAVAANVLRDVLEEIAGERGNLNPRILGRWIERNADRRCDGLWLERIETRRTCGAQWHVRACAKQRV